MIIKEGPDIPAKKPKLPTRGVKKKDRAQSPRTLLPRFEGEPYYAPSEPKDREFYVPPPPDKYRTQVQPQGNRIPPQSPHFRQAAELYNLWEMLGGGDESRLAELARNTPTNFDPTVTGGGYVYGPYGTPGAPPYVYMGLSGNWLDDVKVWLHENAHHLGDITGPPENTPFKAAWWDDFRRTANQVAASRAWDRQLTGAMTSPALPYPFNITSRDPWQQGVDVIREHPGMATNFYYPRGPRQIPGAATGSEPKQEFVDQGPQWGFAGELYAELVGKLLGNRYMIPPPLQRFFPGVGERRDPNTLLFRPYNEWEDW